jgi:LacI family transcriptional regulator
MLDGPDPPTAFVVSSIIPAIGVRRAVGERGLRLGRDLALICHDDVLSYLSNDAEGPAFTATRSSIRAAGRALRRNPDRPDPQPRPAPGAGVLGRGTDRGPLHLPRPGMSAERATQRAT